MRTVILTSPINYQNELDIKRDDYVICCDYACEYAIKNNIKVDLGIGDFDSLKEVTLDDLSKVINLEVSSNVKNETDTFLALQKAKELTNDEIVIYGGLGNRIDHTLASINLLDERTTIISNQAKLELLLPGEYNISNDYKYISFFAIEDVKSLTLKNFKYEINNYDLNRYDSLCVSNEGSGIISFKEGKVLVVKQNEY